MLVFGRENGTVESAQTVSLRGVRKGDVWCGARRSNLDLCSSDAVLTALLIRSHLLAVWRGATCENVSD